MRIAVPFGKSKIYTSVAIAKHQNAPTLYEAKEIYQIVDEKPIVNQIQINHWQWIADYYMCSIGDVLRSALPSILLLESETILSIKNNDFFNESELSDDEFLIFQALQIQSSLKISDIEKILNKKKIFPIIQKLLNKNMLFLNEEVTEVYKPKLVRYVRLYENYLGENGLSILLELVAKSKKQKEVILGFFQLQAQEKKIVSVKQLIEKSNSNSTIIKALIEKNVFEEYCIQHDRVDFEKNKGTQELILSELQNEALKEIKISFETKEVCLFHGVTSSGKTEVYTKLIEEYLLQKKQVLYLLPEIALTTQLVTRLTKYFGNQVAVFHSKYSNNERVEVWNQVLNNSEKAKIVIGARDRKSVV